MKPLSDFIIGLERDYPSTVSTIARTCGKLAPKPQSDIAQRCFLCERYDIKLYLTLLANSVICWPQTDAPYGSRVESAHISTGCA
jgi:hypothetical protein